MQEKLEKVTYNTEVETIFQLPSDTFHKNQTKILNPAFWLS